MAGNFRRYPDGQWRRTCAVQLSLAEYCWLRSEAARRKISQQELLTQLLRPRLDAAMAATPGAPDLAPT